MKRYFITGTDTDCGKTYATRSLIQALPKALALKPVASGCMEVDGKFISTDAQQLQKDKGMSLDEINPWRFKMPVSPHIAAHNAGVQLSVAEIASYCLKFQPEGVEQIFIEGAGGLMVPLNDEETWVDFLQITKIPVILVVGMKLGCINHALLTEATLVTHNIPCVGWIANCIAPKMEALSANIATLTKKLASPLITTLAFGEEVSTDVISKHL